MSVGALISPRDRRVGSTGDKRSTKQETKDLAQDNGIGYFIAASDSRTHWPIVLVGLLGKVFGPVGFLVALLRGTFPPLFGLTIITNDLLWWIPFAMILRDAAVHQRKNLPLRE